MLSVLSMSTGPDVCRGEAIKAPERAWNQTEPRGERTAQRHEQNRRIQQVSGQNKLQVRR